MDDHYAIFEIFALLSLRYDDVSPYVYIFASYVLFLDVADDSLSDAPLLIFILVFCLQAMIDSEATLNFIHEFIVRQLSLKTIPYSLTQIILVDDKMLSHANHQVILDYHIANIFQRNTFLIASIDDHFIILEMS